MTQLMQFINANFMAAVQDQYHYWDFDTDMRSASVSRMWKEHYNDNIETVKDKSPTLFALWCNETGWSETKAIEQFNKQQQEQLKTNNKMKKSKVIGVQSTGEWNGMFKFEIDFENGDGGTYFCKAQANAEKNFPVGEEVEYEITPSGRGYKVKPLNYAGASSTGKQFTPSSKPTTSAPAYGQKSPETETRIARMNALTNAVNWASAKGVKHEQEILLIADSFHDFIVNGLVKDSDGIPF